MHGARHPLPQDPCCGHPPSTHPHQPHIPHTPTSPTSDTPPPTGSAYGIKHLCQPPPPPPLLPAADSRSSPLPCPHHPPHLLSMVLSRSSSCARRLVSRARQARPYRPTSAPTVSRWMSLFSTRPKSSLSHRHTARRMPTCSGPSCAGGGCEAPRGRGGGNRHRLSRADLDAEAYGHVGTC